MNENTTTNPPPPINDRFQLCPIDGPPHVLAALEALLKYPGRILHELKSGRAGAVAFDLLAIAFVCLGIYGVVVGSLAGGSQMAVAPAKILLGSAAAALICLPSLYIFLCLGGVDTHLRAVVGELLAAVSLMSLLLIGFAPVAWVFSQSTDSIGLMAALHLLFWVVALCFGLRLIGRSSLRVPSAGVAVWMVIYVVVCLQMMTALRPIVGRGETFLPGEKMFFLEHMGKTLGSETSRQP